VTKSPTNIAASVRARLINVARARKEDVQLILTRYANERLLYRLSSSPEAKGFVLKGAALFTLWTGQPHRATRDLDLLALRDGSEDHVRGVFEQILSTKVIDDGVVFDLSTLTVRLIREDQEYGGVRVTVVAKIDSARVSLQVDVGFGDAITPRPSIVDYPVLLDFPAPRLHVYPRETVIAEKLDAMVQLGIANSRMKDFFDVHVLAQSFDFDSMTLVRAVKATFYRRKTPLPMDVPIALTQEFASDKSKGTQWRAFLSKSGADSEAMSLPQVVADISAFLLPVIEAARGESAWRTRWPAGGPWGPSRGSETADRKSAKAPAT
jgi:predicted nucleotidyltransferase component of viral defense system